MKKNNVLLLLFLLLITSCVQKSFQKTVTLNLNVAGMKDIKTVGVRGEGKPLSWRQDIEMKPLVKDSLYTVTVTGETGYKFVEIKFAVNGDMELKESNNRKVYFTAGDTTVYNAVFNHANQ